MTSTSKLIRVMVILKMSLSGQGHGMYITQYTHTCVPHYTHTRVYHTTHTTHIHMHTTHAHAYTTHKVTVEQVFIVRN